MCITGDIGVGGLAPGTCIKPGDLDMLLDKPVQQGPDQSAEFRMTSPDDMSKQEQVATCRDYEEHRSKSWYALTGADMAKEGWFKRTCGTIAILRNARPARHSYLGDPDTGLSDPKLISAGILPSAGEGLIGGAGNSVGDFVATGTVKINSSSKRQLDLTYNGVRVVYDELARGDFDEDGFEDILVFMGVRAVGGSLRWYEHLALSRKASGEMLQLVPNEGV